MHRYIHTHTYMLFNTTTAFPFVLSTVMSWVTGKEIYFKKVLGILFVDVSINLHG